MSDVWDGTRWYSLVVEDGRILPSFRDDDGRVFSDAIEHVGDAHRLATEMHDIILAQQATIERLQNPWRTDEPPPGTLCVAQKVTEGHTVTTLRTAPLTHPAPDRWMPVPDTGAEEEQQP